ncbi:MAG: hypothetical protein G8345_09985 [Magnetococcales bacterium]|nr:hypothetical protein [Magnetococcales bacterium]NGZ27200.1 hypothetical protein [Magnetococcales bacterium]
MVQPALKADTLLERVAELWEKSLTIPENYLPLERLQKEAEELDKPGMPGRETAWLVLAFIHAIKWNRANSYNYIQRLITVSAKDVVIQYNIALIYYSFCDFHKSIKCIDIVNAVDKNFKVDFLVSLYFLVGRWRSVGPNLVEVGRTQPSYKLVSYIIEVDGAQDIIDKFNVSDDHIIFILKIASEVLIEVNTPMLKFSVEVVLDDILVTYYVDNRRCKSGLDLTMRFLDKLHQHPDHAKNYGRIVISFVASSLEELQGDGETG